MLFETIDKLSGALFTQGSAYHIVFQCRSYFNVPPLCDDFHSARCRGCDCANLQRAATQELRLLYARENCCRCPLTPQDRGSFTEGACRFARRSVDAAGTWNNVSCKKGGHVSTALVSKFPSFGDLVDLLGRSRRRSNLAPDNFFERFQFQKMPEM